MKVRVYEKQAAEQIATDRGSADVVKAVEAAVEEARFLVRQSPLRLVVAFSGGEDSRALLHILRGLASSQQLELIVAHLNHGLRPESEQEAKFAQALARSYRLPCHIGRVPSWDKKENIESWARRVRYEFLYRCLDAVQGHLIVTAHHMNDQAETVLQRFLSGRLSSDARAIDRLNLERKIFRPLLHVEKSELESYSQEQQLEFVVDRSNFDMDRTRNLIRHKVLPDLRQSFNPSLVRTLSQFADRLRDDEEVLWQVAKEEFARLNSERSITGMVDRLIEMPAGIAWRVVSLIATAQLGQHKLGYRVLSAIRDRVRNDPSTNFRLNLGFGVTANYCYQRGLEFSLDEDAPIKISLLPESLPVPGQVERDYGVCGKAMLKSRIIRAEPDELEFYIQQARSQRGSVESGAIAFFDAGLLDLDLLSVRERADGDEVRVFQRGSRKVKKLLQEAKVAAEMRDALPFILSGAELLLIPGVCRSDIAPIQSSTRQILEITYERLPLSNAHKSW